MDDDGDMAEMYLTEKKKRMEGSLYGDQSLPVYRTNDCFSLSAPVSPVSSPPESRRLEKSLSIVRSRHDSARSSEDATENIEELEMLLEAYFVVIDSTLNKLTSLKEYIDDTEDFINIQLVYLEILIFFRYLICLENLKNLLKISGICRITYGIS
jgi:magnesium transporter